MTKSINFQTDLRKPAGRKTFDQGEFVGLFLRGDQVRVLPG